MTRVSPTDPSLRAQRKLYNVSTGAWETAVVNTEYESPNQHGGIHGVIYRQYFTTALTSTNPRLDTGGRVAKLVDFQMHTHIGTVFYAVHGSTRGYSTAEADIQRSSSTNNLSLVLATHVLDDGCVDYVKT